MDFVTKSPQFSTLTKLLGDTKLAGMVVGLEGKSPVTVFAPTDEAFAALPPDILNKLLKPENAEALKQVLTYHVAQGGLQLSKSPQLVDSVNSNDATVLRDGGNRSLLFNQGATGLQAFTGSTPLQAQNKSVIIPITEVLIPPDLTLI
ncbi:MAG: fasciclin domain-containing protein [Vampirovibrionales bacterium]